MHRQGQNPDKLKHNVDLFQLQLDRHVDQPPTKTQRSYKLSQALGVHTSRIPC